MSTLERTHPSTRPDVVFATPPTPAASSLGVASSRDTARVAAAAAEVSAPMASAPGDLERAPPASTSAPGDYPIGTRACALGSMTIHWRPSHTTTALKVTVSLALGGLSLALFLCVSEVSAALVFGGALFLKASADMVVAIRADAADLYRETADDEKSPDGSFVTYDGPFVTYDAVDARPSS